MVCLWFASDKTAVYCRGDEIWIILVFMNDILKKWLLETKYKGFQHHDEQPMHDGNYGIVPVGSNNEYYINIDDFFECLLCLMFVNDVFSVLF